MRMVSSRSDQFEVVVDDDLSPFRSSSEEKMNLESEAVRNHI